MDSERRLHHPEIAKARMFLARAQRCWIKWRLVEARGYVAASLDTTQRVYKALKGAK